MKKGHVRWANTRVAPAEEFQTSRKVISCDNLSLATNIPSQRLKRPKTPTLSGDVHGVKHKGRPMTSVNHTNRVAHPGRPVSSSWSPDSWSKAALSLSNSDKTHSVPKKGRQSEHTVPEKTSSYNLGTVSAIRNRPKTAGPHLAKVRTSNEEEDTSWTIVAPLSDHKVNIETKSRIRAASLAVNILKHKKRINKSRSNENDVIVLSSELLPRPWKLGRSRVIGRKHGDREDPFQPTKTTEGENTDDDTERSNETIRKKSFSASMTMAMFSARIKQRLNRKRMEEERLHSEMELLHREDSEGQSARPGSGWLAKYVRAVEAGLSTDHLIQRAEDLRVPVSTRWARREREKMEAAMAEKEMSDNVGGLPVSAQSQRLIQEELESKVRDFLSKDLP